MCWSAIPRLCFAGPQRLENSLGQFAGQAVPSHAALGLQSRKVALRRTEDGAGAIPWPDDFKMSPKIEACGHLNLVSAVGGRLRRP